MTIKFSIVLTGNTYTQTHYSPCGEIWVLEFQAPSRKKSRNMGVVSRFLGSSGGEGSGVMMSKPGSRLWRPAAGCRSSSMWKSTGMFIYSIQSAKDTQC